MYLGSCNTTGHTSCCSHGDCRGHPSNCYCDANCAVFKDCCGDAPTDCPRPGADQSMTIMIWRLSTNWDENFAIYIYIIDHGGFDNNEKKVYIIMYAWLSQSHMWWDDTMSRTIMNVLIPFCLLGETQPYLAIIDEYNLHFLSLDGERMTTPVSSFRLQWMDYHYKYDTISYSVVHEYVCIPTFALDCM